MSLLTSRSAAARVPNLSTRPVATPTTRSRASSVAPTYTSAARSAMLRPSAAVVFAAVACADAASRVRFLAAVRVRLAVVLLGDLAAVERVVDRVLVLLRAVERRVAGLRVLVLFV